MTPTDAVSQAFDIPEAQILARGRKQPVVEARFSAMLIMRQTSDKTTTGIADEFGLENHTTICHGVKRALDMCSTEADYRRKHMMAMRLFLNSQEAQMHQEVCG